MAKTLDMMTAAEIGRASDKASELCSINCRALINAGRGMERGSEIREKTDPLALEYILVNDAFNAICDEIRARKRYHGSLKRIIRKNT